MTKEEIIELLITLTPEQLNETEQLIEAAKTVTEELQNISKVNKDGYALNVAQLKILKALSTKNNNLNPGLLALNSFNYGYAMGQHSITDHLDKEFEESLRGV